MGKRLSFRTKLALNTTLSTALGIFIAAGALLALDSKLYRENLLRDLEYEANMLSTFASTPIRNADRPGLTRVLSSIKDNPRFLGAAVYGSNGVQLAKYGRTKSITKNLPERPLPEGPSTTDDRFRYYKSVIQKNRFVGSVMVESDLGDLYTRQWSYMLFTLVSSLMAAIVAIFVGSRFLHSITTPVWDLLRAMEVVSRHKNFSLRLEKTSQDEVGRLAEGFNQMLSEIEQRDTYLKSVNVELEDRVRQRTIELRQEVAERSRAEEALATANSGLEVALQSAKEMAQEAESASRAKSQFLANISHEIRTPMNGIIGMTSLLLDTSLGDEQSDYAVTIRKSADALMEIINNVLDFSKAEAGKMSIESIEFSLHSVLEDCCGLFGQRAHEKGLELGCLIDPRMPALTLGDPGRLRQVISNLVNNAIKFTDRGEVVVEATVREMDDFVNLRITVRDTGIGIPDNRREAVFESFTQADGSTTRKYGGTGLGLTICRQLIEAMGGAITLESEEGHGSKFHVDLRLPVVAGAEAVAQELSGVRVLAVDDNSTNLRILREQLKGWGCRVTTTQDPREALPMMLEAVDENQPFEIVITDMQMPNLDGSQLAKRILESPIGSSVPLVLLTSMHQAGERQRARQDGFAEVLVKPASQSALHGTLVRLLGRKQEGEIQKPKGHRRAFHARVLLVEDNPINQKVAVQLLQRLGCEVTIAGDGQTAYQKVVSNSYDVVFMDIQMPIMDGFEATNHIRQWESEQGIYTKIVAMTANSTSEDRARCLKSGMDDYLCKPVKPKELLAVLERQAPHTKEGEAAPLSKTAPQTYADSSVLNLGRVLQTLDDDHDALREILFAFAEAMPKQLATLEEALKAEDWNDIVSAAHSIKGAAHSVGALDLAQLCGDIEAAAKHGQPFPEAGEKLRLAQASLVHAFDSAQTLWAA